MLLRPAPHPYIRKCTNAAKCAHMRTSLHPAAENGQHLRLGSRKVIDRHRGHGCCTHLGDQSPIHRHQRLSRIGTKQLDHRHMRELSQCRVAGIEGDHLGPHHRAVYGRHHPEPAAILRHWNDIAQRLPHAAAGKIHQRPPDCRDQFLVGKQCFHLFFSQHGASLSNLDMAETEPS